jgi:hypothetical protein
MKKSLFLFILLTFTTLCVNAQTPWYLTGNAGSNPSSNFIGTTDNQPLIFKTRGFERMQLMGDKSFLGIGFQQIEINFFYFRCMLKSKKL